MERCRKQNWLGMAAVADPGVGGADEGAWELRPSGVQGAEPCWGLLEGLEAKSP